MTVSEELSSLVAALPGKLWRSDGSGLNVSVDHALLRIVGFGEGAMSDHRWLAAIADDDLVSGSLVWQPHSPGSSVSCSAFRLKSSDGAHLKIRVLAVPLKSESDEDASWIGTFFRDRGALSPDEFVAAALLQRIAALGGFISARPTGLAPLPIISQASDRRTPGERPLAIILNCPPSDAETLELLLDILGWRIVVADGVTAALARAATTIFVNDNLLSVPPEIDRPFHKRPTVVCIVTERTRVREELITTGCRLLESPISVEAAETIIFDSRPLPRSFDI